MAMALKQSGQRGVRNNGPVIMQPRKLCIQRRFAAPQRAHTLQCQVVDGMDQSNFFKFGLIRFRLSHLHHLPLALVPVLRYLYFEFAFCL
jgi:hypothetical protein